MCGRQVIARLLRLLRRVRLAPETEERSQQFEAAALMRRRINVLIVDHLTATALAN
jgi:hypothetical protein